VVVVANPSERPSIDRTTYIVRDTAEARSSNVLEVLDRIPSVEVTVAGQLRLLGRSGVRILIDGNEVANPQAVLRNLQGSQVARIEVITNPSAQFSGQGTGGIINIILRRSFASGVAGSATASVGSYGTYNARLSPTWSRGRFSASASVGGNRTVFPIDFESRRTMYDANGTAVSESVESGNRRTAGRSVNGNLIATFRPARGQSIGFTATASHSDGESSGHSQLRSTLDPGNALTQTQTGALDFDSRDVGFDYRREGRRPGELLTIAVRRSITSFSADTDYSTESALAASRTLNIRTDSATHLASARIDYLLPFDGRRRLAFGGAIQRRRDDEASEVAGRLPLNGDPFSNASTVGGSFVEKAAYLTYQFPWLGGTILAGLRVEGRRFEVDGVSGRALRGTNLLPSLHVERSLTSALTAGLSYSRRVDWPTITQLSPALRFSNSTTATTGNAVLQPNITDSFELKLSGQLSGQNVEITAFERLTHDFQGDLAELNADGVLISRTVNLGTEMSRGANLAVRGPIGGGFSYFVDANISDERIDNASPLVTVVRDGLRYGASATIEYRDGAEGRRGFDHIEVRARYLGPSRLGLASGAAIFSTGASWSHAFTERFSSVVQVSEFLGPPTTRYRQVSDTSISRQFERAGGPRITFSLTFSLGSSRQ
jgi:outer membrane receptor protein involved in Fe transport